MIAAVVVLTVLTLLNIMLLLAVVRRLRVLEERVGDVPDLALPSAGTTVAAFSAPDLDGEPIGPADVAGDDVLVVFVTTGCRPCHDLVDRLRTDDRPDPARTVVFVAGDGPSTAATELAALVSDFGRTALVATDGPVTRAFGGISAFPALLRLSGGRITAAGRVPDDVVPTAQPA